MLYDFSISFANWTDVPICIAFYSLSSTQICYAHDPTKKIEGDTVVNMYTGDRGAYIGYLCIAVSPSVLRIHRLTPYALCSPHSPLHKYATPMRER